jgi:hypothetical protein
MLRIVFFSVVAFSTFVCGIAAYGFTRGPVLLDCMTRVPPPTKEQQEEWDRATATREVIKDDVDEAVFRYLFRQHPNIKVYFLSRGVGDGLSSPTDAFMSRFRGRSPAVKKVMESYRSQYEIKDPVTDERGLILHLSGIQTVGRDHDWSSSSVVFEVTASWAPTGMHKTECKFRVRRESGNLRVEPIMFGSGDDE